MRAALRQGVALVVLLAPAAVAQVPDSTGAPSLHELHRRQKIRLAVSGLGRVQGRVLESGDSALVLSGEPVPRRIAPSAVDTVWTRGRNTLKGALFGGLGLAAAAGLAAASLGESSGTESGDVIVGGAAVGLVGGALIGALVGTAIPRWKRRFP